SNRRKRTFHTDDIKIAIYLELLAKTHPPVLHRGVSREVAHKFELCSVYGGKDRMLVEYLDVINKLVKNCGRKRIEIDTEAIKAIPLRERTTFQDLANALGKKKSTIHNRFKESYFRDHPMI
ncbi:hypothetical protein U9M48_010128, partial [Paspalum notatum var. saurae]